MIANRLGARQRLGVRQPSGAFDRAVPSESARGLAQSKTLRRSNRSCSAASVFGKAEVLRALPRQRRGVFENVRAENAFQHVNAAKGRVLEFSVIENGLQVSEQPDGLLLGRRGGAVTMEDQMFVQRLNRLIGQVRRCAETRSHAVH